MTSKRRRSSRAPARSRAPAPAFSIAQAFAYSVQARAEAAAQRPKPAAPAPAKVTPAVIIEVPRKRRRGAPIPPPLDGRHVEGAPLFWAPVQIRRPKAKKRADVAKIRAWLSRRKDVQWWRNRDGSYDAVVTVRNRRGNALEVAQSLILSAPRPSYFQFRYMIVIVTPLDPLDDDGPTLIQYKGKDIVIQFDRQATERRKEITKRTMVGRVQRDTVTSLAALVGAARGLDDTCIGFSIFWPKKG